MLLVFKLLCTSLNAGSTPTRASSRPIRYGAASALSPTLREKGSAPKAYLHHVDIYLAQGTVSGSLTRHDHLLTSVILSIEIHI